MRIVRELPEAVRVVRHVWIPMRDGVRLSARLWLPERRRATPGPGDPRVHPVPQARPTRRARRIRATATSPATATRACASTCAAAATPRASSSRVPAAGAGRRRGGARLARRAAMVHRSRRHDRHLVGRLQRPAGRRAAPAAARRRRQPLLDRRPLRRRRALHGRRLLGIDMLSWASTMLAYNSRPPDPEVVGERWRELWLERLRRDAAVHRGLALATSAATRSGSKDRCARTTPRSRARLHGRRLGRRLHERDLPRSSTGSAGRARA